MKKITLTQINSQLKALENYAKDKTLQKQLVDNKYYAGIDVKLEHYKIEELASKSFSKSVSSEIQSALYENELLSSLNISDISSRYNDYSQSFCFTISIPYKKIEYDNSEYNEHLIALTKRINDKISILQTIKFKLATCGELTQEEIDKYYQESLMEI